MVIDTSPGVTRPGIDFIRTVQADGFPRKIRIAGPRHALTDALQSRQWHALTIIGSAETMTLNAPHRHLAVLGIFVVSSDLWSDPISARARVRKKTSNPRLGYDRV